MLETPYAKNTLRYEHSTLWTSYALNTLRYEYP